MSILIFIASNLIVFTSDLSAWSYQSTQTQIFAYVTLKVLQTVDDKKEIYVKRGESIEELKSCQCKH